jgi:AraC family transcriptional regulator of adaptative response/methylated-DNA-[protein]-cysteine methyltransferase
VKSVIAYIEAHFTEKITLHTLSKFTGFCPNHLQETFKRIVGVSPKAFYDAKRLERFKQLLRNGEAISAATYGAGFESSRAVYEKSNSRMGMTPSAYQRGGEGVTVRYSIIAARPGRLLVASTEKGICAVLAGNDAKHLTGALERELPKAVLIRDKVIRSEWIEAVRSCEPEDPLISNLADASRKQVFEVKMWKALG